MKTTPLFWDCECDTQFIHPRWANNCTLCGSVRSTQPDSRWDETIGVLDDILAEDETRYCLTGPECNALEAIRDYLMDEDAEWRIK